MLSQEVTDIITATVPVIQQYGRTVTDVFYVNLLRDYPSLNEVFNRGNQATGHQSQALATAVLAYAQHITSPQVLGPALDHICNKHASLYVRPEQYAVVGKYLLDAFREVLGEAFTPQIRDAWAAAYTELANLMIGAEAEIYKKANGWTDWREFVVSSKNPESSEITSFTLRPKDGKPLPPFLPGQYVSIRVLIAALGHTQTRQYSLSDAHSADYYRISVKKERGVALNDVEHPGLVSNVLHADINVGDAVQLSKPQGVFSLDLDTTPDAPLVLISAGVGITPMMSMLNTASKADPTKPISWIHGANTSVKRAFAAHIEQSRQSHENLQITRFVSNPTEDETVGVDYEHVGRVDLDKIANAESVLFLTHPSTRYFVCGPDTFMSSIQHQLGQRGVGADRVQVEKFGTGGF